MIDIYDITVTMGGELLSRANVRWYNLPDKGRDGWPFDRYYIVPCDRCDQFWGVYPGGQAELIRSRKVTFVT
jgi:hypothetical protein